MVIFVFLISLVSIISLIVVVRKILTVAKNVRENMIVGETFTSNKINNDTILNDEIQKLREEVEILNSKITAFHSSGILSKTSIDPLKTSKMQTPYGQLIITTAGSSKLYSQEMPVVKVDDIIAYDCSTWLPKRPKYTKSAIAKVSEKRHHHRRK